MTDYAGCRIPLCHEPAGMNVVRQHQTRGEPHFGSDVLSIASCFEIESGYLTVAEDYNGHASARENPLDLSERNFELAEI